MDRIFTACHGTQLLVIQHLRRHLLLPPGRDFLVWHPQENSPFIDDFMQRVISTAEFADVLDMRDFQSLRPRTAGPVAWSLESVRRLRRDATVLRIWLAKNGITESEAELWADDPIHLNVSFLRGLLRKSRQIKIPHSFNHDDVNSVDWKRSTERQWRDIPWAKRFLFLPWQRWASGVDLRMERICYQRGYTFDLPSCWAADSIDVSPAVSIDAFDATYQTLPASTRAEVEANLAPILTAPRPLVLLLLFGLHGRDEEKFGPIYQRSLRRIFADRASELRNCSLAVKVHPGSYGDEEQKFFDWLRDNVPARILPITHALNLEFLLPQLRPDYVLAGLCGALPIVRRLGVARPVALSEMINLYSDAHPAERESIDAFLTGIEIW